MDLCKNFLKIIVHELQGELDENWEERRNSTGLRKSPVLEIPPGRLREGIVCVCVPFQPISTDSLPAAASGTVPGQRHPG